MCALHLKPGADDRLALANGNPSNFAKPWDRDAALRSDLAEIQVISARMDSGFARMRLLTARADRQLDELVTHTACERLSIAVENEFEILRAALERGDKSAALAQITALTAALGLREARS